MTYCEYPCGCTAKSASMGQWALVHMCEQHKAPPPLEDLLRGPMTFDIEKLERQVREDDMHFRHQWARYKAHEQCINSMTEFAANSYAQAIGSMWAMALNPNLKDDAQ